MATSPISDVLPVRKATKARLTSVKGAHSYDQLLQALLSLVPLENLRDTLESRQKRLERQVEARKVARGRGGQRERSTEKQVLIARLAEARWKKWFDDGRVVAVGPRLFDWRTDIRDPKAGIQVDWEPRRGDAAPESPQDPR